MPIEHVDKDSWKCLECRRMVWHKNPSKAVKCQCVEEFKMSRRKFLSKEFEFWFEHESYGDTLTTSCRKDRVHKDTWKMVEEAFFAGADAQKAYNRDKDNVS